MLTEKGKELESRLLDYAKNHNKKQDKIENNPETITSHYNISDFTNLINSYKSLLEEDEIKEILRSKIPKSLARNLVDYDCNTCFEILRVITRTYLINK